MSDLYLGIGSCSFDFRMWIVPPKTCLNGKKHIFSDLINIPCHFSKLWNIIQPHSLFFSLNCPLVDSLIALDTLSPCLPPHPSNIQEAVYWMDKRSFTSIDTNTTCGGKREARSSSCQFYPLPDPRVGFLQSRKKRHPMYCDSRCSGALLSPSGLTHRVKAIWWRPWWMFWGYKICVAVLWYFTF